MKFNISEASCSLRLVGPHRRCGPTGPSWAHSRDSPFSGLVFVPVNAVSVSCRLSLISNTHLKPSLLKRERDVAEEDPHVLVVR